ncbi:hypothetical protein [Absidia glauca]|uniref:Uncharacterized protein n=1 Tax=Absidia glauca TaxID=4829 RepID=A0A168L605_ABSGL|nr:hypothetical protein [Absidia glauca]
MDDTSPSGHEFPSYAPIRYTITILHLLTMSLSLCGIYPYAVIQRSSQPSQKRRLVSLGFAWLLVFVGFVSGWFIPYSFSTSRAVLAFHICLCLAILLLITIDLTLEYLDYRATNHPQERENEPQHRSWAYLVPEVAGLVMQWTTLYFGYLYLISCVLVFTASCTSLGQFWLPLSIGTGLLSYGSLAFMHLVGLFSLPRLSCLEYYEAICLLVGGLISFIWWDSLVVGSSWKVINLSLLWSTGGLLSLVLTLQDWIPLLQKRNIVNAITLCLTGQGILSGQLMDDPYATQLQSTLGYALMIGSVARLIYIIYRKSPADDLQRLYARASGATDGNCDSTMNRTHVDNLDIGHRREADYESTYRQLTGMDAIPAKCNHQSVYASITMVSGLVSCFAVISAGLLFIGTIVEWVESVRYYIGDPTIYVNVLLSVTFLWMVYLVIMNTLYKLCTKPNSKYDYIDLATGDYDDSFVPRKSSSSSSSSSPTTYLDNDNAANSATPTSSTSTTYDPTQQHEFTSVALLPLASATSSSVSKSNGTPASPSSTSPPFMRPSQYRAKRRSLLISTSSHSIHQDNSKSSRGPRTFSSSSYSGVGGVLPDAVPLYLDDHHTSSPVQSPNAALCDALEQQDAAVHKTESGKRKDRQWEKSKRRRATVTGVNGYTQENYHGDDQFPSTNSRLAYYPTDSHVV